MGIHDTDPNTPNKEFAPEGWNLPSNTEWTTFEEYLIANGYNYDGTTEGNKIAKAISSQSGWLSNSDTDFGDLAYNPENTFACSSGFNFILSVNGYLTGELFQEILISMDLVHLFGHQLKVQEILDKITSILLTIIIYNSQRT